MASPLPLTTTHIIASIPRRNSRHVCCEISQICVMIEIAKLTFVPVMGTCVNWKVVVNDTMHQMLSNKYISSVGLVYMLEYFHTIGILANNKNRMY